MGEKAASSILIDALRLCSSWNPSVTQQFSQIQAFPSRFLESVGSVHDLKEFYLDSSPLVTAFALSLAFAPIFLVVSEVNRNYSQVDRCWSLLPTFYIGHFTLWAHLKEWPTQRLDLLLGCATLWSMRLSFNYWRKGGYSVGSEDYRWEILRKHVNAPIFFIFNVTFISLIQSVLLFTVATPAYILALAGRVGGEGLNLFDYAFAGGMVTLILTSAIADQQQWNYHEAKNSYKKTAVAPSGYSAADLERGFNTKGLWGLSRHPNFAAEQGVWLTVFQWSCVATYSFFNWSGVGVISYLCLFQGSTWLTELITAGKYPEYKEYQRRVSMFLPKLSSFSTSPVAESLSKVVEPRKKQ